MRLNTPAFDKTSRDNEIDVIVVRLYVRSAS